MECACEKAGQVMGVQGRMHRMLDPHDQGRMNKPGLWAIIRRKTRCPGGYCCKANDRGAQVEKMGRRVGSQRDAEDAIQDL